jgi:hypothetical protein
MRRVSAGVLGVLFAINGLVMLVDSAGWFARLPGGNANDPLNAHFVQDVGVAYLVSGVGLLALASRTCLWPAAAAGALFQLGHAGLHLAGILRGHSPVVVFELLTVVLPAVVATAIAWPRRAEWLAMAEGLENRHA